MNYRHAFHAGNFADVLKHAVLALAIERLKQKAAAFRVIDTHAGIGLYALDSDQAQRTGEWRDGIGRLIGPDAVAIPEALSPLLAPYLDAVRAFNPGGRLDAYPGSPVIARHLLRPQDTLIANELHPEDGAVLEQHFARDRQTKVMALDGWVALRSLLPPKERRGLILVDPPFEEPGELQRLESGLADAVRRFATGAYVLWYPIKDDKPVRRFQRRIAQQGHAKLMRMDLFVRAPRNPELLNGCGLILLNPPYPLEEVLGLLGDFLATTLECGKGARCEIEWLHCTT